MNCCVADVVRFLEKLVPAGLAEPWDNAGLQVGSGAWPVNLLWVALDALPEVVSRACEAKVDMLVTHHPLIFKPLKRVDMAEPEGAIIEKAIKNRMAIYAAHTNLDAVKEGINDILASKIGLKDVIPLTFSDAPDVGALARFGSLPKETTLISFARHIKKILRVPCLRISGDSNLKVKNIMICSGSGSSLLMEFLKSNADVFVSGDLRYHDARSIEAAGRGLVDIGHFASEHVMVESFSKRLGRLMKDASVAVTVEPYLHEKDPFVFV